MKGYADKLIDEKVDMESELEERISEVADLKVQLVEERDRSMGYTKEIEELKSELDELSKAYKDSTHEEITMKKAWREQREIVALRDDQIAMLERRLAKKDNPYPFKEGDIYYVLNQLDGTWIESVWDDESERIHDSPDVPSRPHRVYFTVDQKNVLGKFKFEHD
jgi:DNA repair exonuclease SbcCD ATPase subunit